MAGADGAAVPSGAAPRRSPLRLARVVVAGAVAAGLFVATATPTISGTADYAPVGRARLRSVIQASTLRIAGLDCTLASRIGTAVAYEGGRIVTNRHVVDQVRILNVIPDGRGAAVASGTVSVDSDVALVHAGRLGVPEVGLARWDPDPGSTVTVAGFPDGEPQLAIADAVVVDYVDGLVLQESGRVMRIDVDTREGMSGSPVLDRAGRLAGLIYAVEYETGYGLAIPASRLGRTLEDGPFVTASGCQLG